MISPEDRVHVLLSVSAVEYYCHELARYQSKPERRIAALDALRTFIGAMVTPGEKAKAEFSAINETLVRYFEQASVELLALQHSRLALALNEQRLTSIVALYNTLSRDAFWSLLGQTVATLDSHSFRQSAEWCNQWLSAVKARSAAHCSYPDSIDFNAAGIDVTEYAAMQDMDRFFTTTLPTHRSAE